MANEPNADDSLQTANKQISEMMVAIAKLEQERDNIQADLNELSFSSMCQTIQLVWLVGNLPPDTVVMRRDGVDVLASDFAAEMQQALESVEPYELVQEARKALIPENGQ